MTFALPEAVAVRILGAVGIDAASRPPSTSETAKRTPQTVPDRFVQVQAVGGSQRTVALSRRLIQLHCYGRTNAEAAQVAEAAVSALIAARHSTPELRDVTVAGEPSRFPDPDSDRPRYSAVVDMLLRAEP